MEITREDALAYRAYGNTCTALKVPGPGQIGSIIVPDAVKTSEWGVIMSVGPECRGGIEVGDMIKWANAWDIGLTVDRRTIVVVREYAILLVKPKVKEEAAQ